MVEAKEKNRSLACAIKTLNTSSFPEALSNFVSKVAAFDNLIIIAYYGDQNPAVLYREFTDPVVYLPMDSEYVTAAYLLDPFYHEHLTGSTTGLRRLIDIAPDQFKRTSYFNVYYRQTTLIDEVAIFANLGEMMTITACFGKDRSSGKAFPKRELKALKDHETVLSALLEMNWKEYRPDQTLGTRPPLSDRLRDTFEKENGVRLSPRQAEVAMLILRGHSSISIALHLGISPATVKVFRRQLYAKCHISSQAELFAMMMPLFSRLSSSH